MTRSQKQKLYIVLGLLLSFSIATGLVLFALKQNINLYFTPKEVAAGNPPANHDYRVGGLVLKGSVARQGAGLDIRFTLSDGVATLPVHYHGILPDLFREGQGIIVKGRFLPGADFFVANEVLAKHDENYHPPNVPVEGKV